MSIWVATVNLPTGEMLDEYPESLIELDVDNTPSPQQSAGDVFDDSLEPGVTMSEWQRQHTFNEMTDIQILYKLESHEQHGEFCVALDEYVLRTTQANLVSCRASILSREKAKAVRHMYYAVIIKILERLAEEPLNIIRSRTSTSLRH